MSYKMSQNQREKNHTLEQLEEICEQLTGHLKQGKEEVTIAKTNNYPKLDIAEKRVRKAAWALSVAEGLLKRRIEEKNLMDSVTKKSQ